MTMMEPTPQSVPPNTTKDIMWMYVSADGVLVALVVKSLF